MDISLRDMEIRPIYVAEVLRRKRSVFPLGTLGIRVNKRDWVQHAFNTVNFSIILRGGGVYECDGREYPVVAPCVLTQWPGEFVRYGPSGDWESWDELYLIYAPDLLTRFEGAKLLDRRYPVWSIPEVGDMEPLLHRLHELSMENPYPGWVERIDLLCEQLIMESRPISDSQSGQPDQQRIVQIRDEIDRSFLLIDHVDDLAAKHGLSRSAFRRQWSLLNDVSPQRYLMETKMRHACRMLVESSHSIGEIADQIGFEDRLYFSRKFRQVFGLSASEYRKENAFNRMGSEH